MARQKQSDVAKWMTHAISNADYRSNYWVSGSLPSIDPGLVVEGIGPIHLPLSAKQAKALAARSRIAPFGKGTKTIVDENIRKTFELSPKHFELSESWNQLISETVKQLASELNLSDQLLEAKLYKLLLYERGGLFKRHRDSEKRGRMIGSLVVVLPTPFDGGELTIYHKEDRKRVPFDNARSAKSSEAAYVAFYADCEHEVARVKRGRRLCLTYNLVLKSKRADKSSPTNQEATNALASSIASHTASHPTKPLVFALEHMYTERGLKKDLLKGDDRTIATLVQAAAQKTDCRVHLAQIKRHLLQFADDGSWGRQRNNVSIDDLQIGESYEDDLTGECWSDLHGKRQPFGTIALNHQAIVSQLPLDQWKPTDESYEGYTGNAGNTLDRWYQRSAIVVWQNQYHFDIVARGGTSNAIAILESMQSRLPKTAKKRLPQATEDCIKLARVIAKQWPSRQEYSGYFNPDNGPDTLAPFFKILLDLKDKRAVVELLSAMASRDEKANIDSFVLNICRQYGAETLEPQLQEILQASLDRFHDRVASRNWKWLYKLCTNKKQFQVAPDTLHRLCQTAAKRFCEVYNNEPERSYRRVDTKKRTKELGLLLKSLLAVGLNDSASQVISHVGVCVKRFDRNTVQVPCLLDLVPWSTKRLETVPIELADWLSRVQSELNRATSTSPSPPTDWRRSSKIDCDCDDCEELKTFLVDAKTESTVIAARESQREHLIHNIRHYRCDASHQLIKRGSPYRLVLKKTQDSYHRRLKEFETDKTMLSKISRLGTSVEGTSTGINRPNNI